MNPGETMQPSTVTGPEFKPQPIRIVLADDHPIVRDGLRKLLSLEEDIEVVGEASDGREVVQVIQETNPDILILDLRMPYMDGLATLQALAATGKKSQGHRPHSL